MSEENVEIVRAACDAFSGSDRQASLEYMDKAFELVGPRDVTAGGRVTRGHEEGRKLINSFLGAWETYDFQVRDMIDGGDTVLVEALQRARGRGSGVEVSEAIYAVFTVGGGKVTRVQMFRNRAEGLKAAGLSE